MDLQVNQHALGLPTSVHLLTHFLLLSPPHPHPLSVHNVPLPHLGRSNSYPSFKTQDNWYHFLLHSFNKNLTAHSVLGA